MKIPNKVKVGGVTYRITTKEKDIPEHTDAWGLTTHQKSLIYVNINMNRDHQKDTLLHEILHAIFFIYNVHTGDGEERVVTSTASGLMQVFNDNPKIMEFLK